MGSTILISIDIISKINHQIACPMIKIKPTVNHFLTTHLPLTRN